MSMEKQITQEEQTQENQEPVEPAEIVSEDDLDGAIDAEVQSMPIDQKNKMLAHYMKVEKRYSGPLPPAEDFAMYEKTVVGAGDRILKMAEAQSLHRQNIETKAIDAKISDVKRAQFLAFIIAIVVLVGGMFLIFSGKDITGLAVVIGTLTSFVGVYIYEKKHED